VQRYTLLSLRNGRLAGNAPISASDDMEAIELAWVVADESYCELWFGDRLVAFIERKISAANQ